MKLIIYMLCLFYFPEPILTLTIVLFMSGIKNESNDNNKHQIKTLLQAGLSFPTLFV